MIIKFSKDCGRLRIHYLIRSFFIACECNTHSNVCIFDPDVYAQSGGISGGVCINCSDSTAGRHCETCADLFYPRPDRNQTDSDFCAGEYSLHISCNVTNGCECNQWCRISTAFDF